MGWFRRAVDQGIKEGIEAGVKAGIDKAFAKFCEPGGELDRLVWEAIDKRLSATDGPLNRLGFTWALRLCFRRHGSSYAEASDLANSTLRQYLADEKIKFGDPAYAWTRSGAEDVAEEYELRHWEAA